MNLPLTLALMLNKIIWGLKCLTGAHGECFARSEKCNEPYLHKNFASLVTKLLTQFHSGRAVKKNNYAYVLIFLMLLSGASLMHGAENTAIASAEKIVKTDADIKTSADLDLDVFVVPNNMKTMGQIRHRFISDRQARLIEAIFGNLADENVCVEAVLTDPAQANPIQLAYDSGHPQFPNSNNVFSGLKAGVF